MTGRGPLSGVKVVELEALGPAPFCGMLLADLGAQVTLVERPRATQTFGSIVLRGKERCVLDLKAPGDREALLRMLVDADGLIEGMRPGKMEALGLGPDVCLARNPRLAYGRMTGWGQDGPLAQRAGHDINYVALAGGAWYAGESGSASIPPPTLVGDIGGGALYLAVGMLAAIVHARSTGLGQVVDASVVDGVAHMQTLLMSLRDVGQLSDARGEAWIDGAPWYRVYECANGRSVAVGALEPAFFAELMRCLGLEDAFPAESQFDRRRWPDMRSALSQRFLSRTSEHWEGLFEGTDTCVSPVLSPSGAARHPHNVARGTFVTVDGVLQARAAPRFSLFPDTPPNPLRQAPR